MYNQTEAILAQYELEIKQITKGRGTYICNTNQGIKVLTSFRGSKDRGMFLKTYMEKLNSQGFGVEQIYLNRVGEAVTVDEVTGERFILKDGVVGTEIVPTLESEVLEAVRVLATYHLAAERIPDEWRDAGSTQELEVVTRKERHYRELIKARNYIRGKKKKTEFERIYMQQYSTESQVAEESVEILKSEDSKAVRCLMCHGDYNHHNILKTEEGVRIIHFENMLYGWGIEDVANFLRKVMEKNGWDVELGKAMINSYQEIRPLNAAECRQIYGLMLFPEKFWKITNHYMNSRKTWISERDIEKLEKVIDQESLRRNFMENLFSILQ